MGLAEVIIRPLEMTWFLLIANAFGPNPLPLLCRCQGQLRFPRAGTTALASLRVSPESPVECLWITPGLVGPKTRSSLLLINGRRGPSERDQSP